MKLSTKGRYGLRAMVDLAVHSNKDHVALGSIAERQGISANYLEQVFSSLRKAGLVKSIKGSQGGYSMAHDTAKITIGTIIRALEGELKIVDEGESTNMRSGIQTCLKKNVWDKMNKCLNDLVDSITLEDVVNDYNKMNGFENNMYYI